jgi:hypothetical protein
MERTKQVIINREMIGFFKAILESYEEIGIFSVVNGDEGLIELIYPWSSESHIEAIMADMVHYGVVFREVRDV